MEDQIFSKAKAIIDLALDRGWTLGFAESCTGGLLSANMAKIPGVSGVFMGAVVSYNSAVKVSSLGVPKSALQAHGEVSRPVASYMARGAKKHLNCDWSVSITGIAGPGGGTLDKPVGTVCFAVCGPGFEESLRHQFELQKREDIQQHSVLFALDLLLNAMK